MLCQVWPHQESCTKLQQFFLSPETLHVTTLLVLQVTVLRCSFIVTALTLLSYWSQFFDHKCATLVIPVQATSTNGGNMSKLWDAGGSSKEIWFQHWSLLQWMNWFIRWFINSLITWWVSCHMQGVHIIKAHMCWFLSRVASNITFGWSTNTFSSTATAIMMMP